MLCFGAFASSAQDIYEKYNIYRSPLRVFLNKFSWTLSSGYGLTNYSHSLQGFYFYQDRQNQYVLSNLNEPGNLDVFQGFGQWFNNPALGPSIVVEDQTDVPFPYLSDPVNNPRLLNNQFLINADTAGLSFSSLSSTIPVLASVHYDYGKFRIGLGFQYERITIKPLRPSVQEDRIRDYDPGFKTTSNTKIFGLLGYQFYEYWDYTFVAEIQGGRVNAGSQFNTNAIGIGQNFFFNLGVSIEKNLSEYARIILRPSYDIKNYTVNIPGVLPGDAGSSIQHNYNAFSIQIGLSLNIPEIPRAPYDSDHVQLKHVITAPNGQLVEVRGQSIWKKQNPKVGENHRKLWRYKLRNKNKIDPY